MVMSKVAAKSAAAAAPVSLSAAWSGDNTWDERCEDSTNTKDIHTYILCLHTTYIYVNTYYVYITKDNTKDNTPYLRNHKWIDIDMPSHV